MENFEGIYKIYQKSYRVTTDSRKIEQGSIFFALRGENFDGNKFALDALAKGASLAIVDDVNLKNNEGCIFTEDVLAFLQGFANYHRSKLQIPVIGLTGSNGKTTTKELIREVLSYKYKVYATQGNLNNHIGVPLTLLSIAPETEIAVIEMGANHIGEIEMLCSIAKPTHGLITNIGKAHIGEFGGFEGIIKAKTELYKSILKTEGTIFFNSDNEILTNELSKLNLLGSSIDYSIKTFNSRTIPGREPYLTVSLSFPSIDFVIETQMTGSYNLENILAACCIGSYFGVDPRGIKERIENYVPANSRSQIMDKGSNRIVLDAYNANPSSMEAALASFASLPSEKGKVVILGEMLELGEYSDAEHLRIANLAISMLFEEVFLVGKNFPKDIPGTLWFETSTECAEHLKIKKLSEKLLLVKGSRGTRMELVVGEI